MATKARGNVAVERAIDGSSVSTAVIEALADVESVEPTELDVTLYEVIDLDALERLRERTGEDLVLEFTVEDYRVRVRGTNAVIVEPR